MEETEEGIKVAGRLIKALRFADDQAMLATTQEGLQRMMDQLNLTSKKYNMRINISKTKSMKIGREEKEVTAKIKINGGGGGTGQEEFLLLGKYDDSRCKVPK